MEEQFLFRMTHKKLQSYLAISLRTLSFVLVIASFILKTISHTMPGLSVFLSNILVGIVFSGSILCLVTSFKDDLKKFTIVYLCFAMNILGAFPQLSPALIYAIPVLLSFYTMDIPYIKKIILLDSLLFLVARMHKTYIEFITMDFIVGEKNLLMATLGSLIMAIIEIALVIVSSYLFQKFIFLQNAELVKELSLKEKAADDILQFCSTATSYHDKYLSQHIRDVREISKIIISGLKEKGIEVSKKYESQILFSVQFHDIGKIYIDSSILDKPGKLTDEEFRLIREHPQKGYELFSLLPKNCIDSELERVCKNIIIQHHERLDGSGYPFGLKGDELSIGSRIVAVADVADALLSWRPYKNPLSWDRMQTLLLQGKGKLDPDCVDIVLSHKTEIMSVSDKGNISLRELLNLQDVDIIRE